MPLSLEFSWKEAPFLRLVPPFMAGILFYSYSMCASWLLLVTLAAAMFILAIMRKAATALRFRLQWLTGAAINLLLLTSGAFIAYFNHPANQQNWLPKHYNGQQRIKAVIQEPLSTAKAWAKTTAAVKQLHGNNITNVNGNIILHFSPRVKVTELSYGSIIIINKPLIPVKTSGNPGAFDYRQHCIFKNISHQAFLQPHDFVMAPRSETRYTPRVIFSCRKRIIDVLSAYIKGAKERALAEALLIGYKDELDKELVQAYSNTGVVHIIAVSGMHLGIIYLLLGRLLQPLRKTRASRWGRFAAILAGLWIFSLLAGAGPSVVRSAVMFSILLVGDTFSKRSNIYNNLAASAFLLLCYNPFWLWDAGFQLSYAAVLSIVMFFKPVYNAIFVENKLLDAVWKLNAVTIAAQLLTLPITIYHFHQFPNLFLLTNLVAVPLSSILLVGEIVLCLVSFIPLLASPAGHVLNYLISFMNHFIERINALPFTSWTHLYITVPQALLLAIIIIAASRRAFITALASLAIFMMLRSYSFIDASLQQKLIVYNVPGKPAMDFMNGRQYYFMGEAPPALRNFHLEPSRTLHRVAETSKLAGLYSNGPLQWFNGKRIFILDKVSAGALPMFSIDLLVLSQNPPSGLLPSLRPKQVVADGSNSARTIKQWQQDCHVLNIPFHSVTGNGAFMYNAH